MHATNARDKETKKEQAVSEIGLSIPYFPRSADRKNGSRPARPEDPTKAAYWPTLARRFPLRCSDAQAHKPLRPYKGLLRFTGEFLPFIPFGAPLANFFDSLSRSPGFSFLVRALWQIADISSCQQCGRWGVIIPTLFRTRAFHPTNAGNCLSMLRTWSGCDDLKITISLYLFAAAPRRRSLLFKVCSWFNWSATNVFFFFTFEQNH